MAINDRFHDTGQQISAFGQTSLVKCPNCGGCALVQPLNTGDQLRRFVCRHCGSSKDDAPDAPSIGYPLWLQATCRSQNLWAYNLNHLAFLEAFVRAKHRERHHLKRPNYRNSTLFSRLPRWIQSRKHRDEILKTIGKLRASVPSELQNI
jgi:predicted RNA-binding Zn-ribbon protein involved in translation (DUF1610 family)